MYILHTGRYVHSRSEDLGKSPGGPFRPKHCESERAARVGWAPSRSLSKPLREVQRTSTGLDVELGRGSGGLVRNRGAGEALDARQPAHWQGQDGGREKRAAATATRLTALGQVTCRDNPDHQLFTLFIRNTLPR
ncbi:hypothetical protein OG21DRAFT_155065 [Imleria badia]|nr:hypothetical protein OG21DRAFT_155065 [Imleria badia]